MAKDQTIVVRGSFCWAKVLGEARPHTGLPKYDKGPYWSIDVTPDKAGVAALKKAGVADKLKKPKDGDEAHEGPYLHLRHNLNGANGGENKPIRVVDAGNQPWPEDTLIGNGSVGDVKIKIKDYGDTQGCYIQAIRVLDHVPYEGADFEPLKTDDEFFRGGATKDRVATDDFDDDLDVPF